MDKTTFEGNISKAQSLVDTKRFSEAFGVVTELLCENKSDWRIYWLLAQVSVGFDDFATVEQACKAVLNLNPEFWFARELPKHCKGYYSQLGQDEIVECFFAANPPKNKVFIEVGAFDGVHYSNVRRLQESYGWSGLSIEPVEKNYDKLCKSYAEKPVTCVRCAVGKSDGVAELNISSYPHLPDWGSDVATLSESETTRWQQLYGAIWHKEQVQVKTLTTILKEYNISSFDFLSVDAEGHDLDVLMGLDFSLYKPQMILVEYNRDRQGIFDLLTGNGYRLYHDNGQDLFMELVDHNIFKKLLDIETLSRNGDSKHTITVEFIDRINKTISCHDCDYIPKVLEAGKAFEGNPDFQIMHNGIKIIYKAFHGEWMAEVIRQLRGHHEPQEEKVFYEVIKKLPSNAVMIEIGSFWSYYSMWFNKAITNAKTYMIEPNPEKIELGKKHFQMNKMQGSFTRAFVGKDSISNSSFEDWDHTIYTLPQISIDDFLENQNIDFVHLLHSDIQGAEYEMLLGCQRSMDQGKIGYVFISTHGNCHDKCISFLKKHNFNIIASHTIEESYSADGLVVASSHHIQNILPIEISKYSQMHQILIDRKLVNLVLDKLNPHLLGLDILPLDKPIRRASLAAQQLLTCSRFDIIPKLIYATHQELGIESSWARELYEAHIRAFNGCQEGDGSGKSGIETFIASYDKLRIAIKHEGFDTNCSLVPIDRNGVVIDGAHRVATCILYNRQVEAVVFDMDATSYNYEYFISRGLAYEYADAIALEYCRVNPQAYIVTVFPSAVGKDREIIEILEHAGGIFYARQVQLSRLGSINLIRQIYEGEHWVGNFINQFEGAQKKAAECFRIDGPVRFYVLTSDDLEKVKFAKQQIRDLFGISNHSVHINDTHEETVRLGRILLNANSVHFLNNAQLTTFPRFHAHFENYKKILKEQKINDEYLCIDGSSVMSAYGIREARDLDYLHFGYENLVFDYPPEFIGSHNIEISHHVTTRDDILFNPLNHFYYDGLKFSSLGILRAMKQKRGETKDFEDVCMIDRFVNTPPTTPHIHIPTDLDTIDKTGRQPKIVGLVPVRNEQNIIAQCLRALSMFTDAIVYLDDASTDGTPNIVESLTHECKIERIIYKNEWYRDEPGDRNAMLNAGREIGGTHFIVIDADEMLSANLAINDCLVEAIRTLQPGDRIALNWIQLWRSIHEYRFDNSVWSWNYKEVIFCDDGVSFYSSGFIHTPRVPNTLSGKEFIIEGYGAGLLHFQFVNWRNLLVKQAWYHCLEHIRDPNKPVQEINLKYSASTDETDIRLAPSRQDWFAGYSFFDESAFKKPEEWREQQVLEWFKLYGKSAFKELKIWDVDWKDSSLPEISSQTYDKAAKKSNLQYWKELQEFSYFEQQNEELIKKYGQTEYQRRFGSANPCALRDTSNHDLQLIQSFIDLTPDMTVVVIGCGYGRETLAIAPLVKQVYGIDVSHTILDKAQDFLAAKGIYNFTPVLAQNWLKLIPPNLDFVYSITVFQHITKDLVREYLVGLSERFSPNGKALCQFADLPGGTDDAELKTYEPSVNWSPTEIDESIQAAGLVILSIKTIEISGGGFWYWVLFGKRK